MNITTNKFFPVKSAGFSLVEMAVVLVILGFVLAALLLPLQAQRNQLFQTQTENTLEVAKKALIGYAQANGRLPCPATITSGGQEDTTTPGTTPCNQPIGFLPAATLGISPVDSAGLALDGWNNRIRYGVTTSNTNAFTTNTSTNSMNVVGISVLAPNLRICADSSVANCSATTYLSNNAVAVIYSTGSTAASGSGGADETENLNGDAVFVSHDPTTTFDHIVTWISPYVLYNAMIEAGQLH